jgi:DNA-binding XRE family transcriptional regulator
MHKIPTPQQIKAARINCDCTQTEAAELCGVTTRAWQLWEADDRKIPWATWQLFLIKTNQHPIYGLRKELKSTP